MKKLSLFILFTAACVAGCDGKKPSAPSVSGSANADGRPGVNSPVKTPDPKLADKKSPSDPVVSQPVTPVPRRRRTMKELEDAGIIRKLDRTDTIAGIDANGDGIRDDIELYIEEQKVTDKQKSALRFKAYHLQKNLLVDLNDKDELRKVSDEGMRATNCLFDEFPDDDGSDLATKYSRMLVAYTANTRRRTERYIRYNVALSGGVFSMPTGDTCEIH